MSLTLLRNHSANQLLARMGHINLPNFRFPPHNHLGNQIFVRILNFLICFGSHSSIHLNLLFYPLSFHNFQRLNNY